MDNKTRIEKHNRTEQIKNILIFIRNGLAYSFSWLVICVLVVSLLSGNETITVAFLLKVLVLCLWGVIAFAISFKSGYIRKRGFIFSLTVAYILFIPVEIAMFYFMGIFKTGGSLIAWIIFGGIVVLAYLISAFVDVFVMRKKSEIYTTRIHEYISNKE